jgi:hypothetical protein
VQAENSVVRFFSSCFWGSQNKREKEKGVKVIKRKIETNHHMFLAKEKFVFLSFVFSFGE